MTRTPSVPGAAIAARAARPRSFLHPLDGISLDLTVYAGLAALGALLWWTSRYHASRMPALGPWDFSITWFAATSLALWWYARGLLAMPARARPALWRSIVYAAGVLAIYAAMQTQFEYLAQHMFFLNRIQALVLHELGPILVAFGAPGAVLACGSPAWARRAARAPLTRALLRILQQPAIASVLYVLVVAVWLIPGVHFHAMVDHRLYLAMNASMVLDGLLFWFLVLDPRPKPPAHASLGARMLMIMAVMLPQSAIGAVLSLSTRDLYTYYAWCGRIYPSIGAAQDQQLGGLIVWIPSFMIVAAALIFVLSVILREPGEQDAEPPSRALPG